MARDFSCVAAASQPATCMAVDILYVLVAWPTHRARRVGILLDVLHVLLRSGLGHSLALVVSATLTRALGSREEPGGYAVMP